MRRALALGCLVAAAVASDATPTPTLSGNALQAVSVECWERSKATTGVQLCNDICRHLRSRFVEPQVRCLLCRALVGVRSPWPSSLPPPPDAN